MARKKRNVRAYTAVGHRIAALGKRQVSIARVLGISQQTVSRKLRGEVAILLRDLVKLAKHYEVPLTHFFEEEGEASEFAAACERIRSRPGPHQDFLVLASTLPPKEVKRLLQIARAIHRS